MGRWYVCAHINAKDFCNRRRWEKIFLVQVRLGGLHFSFLLHSATFSFQWPTWAWLGAVWREQRRWRAQHGTRQVFLPQGKDGCQIICEWGVPNCWKVRYRTGDRKLWQEEGMVGFFRDCLIVVAIKKKLMVYVSLQSGSWVLLCSQIHSTLHSTRFDFSGFWIRPLEHRPGAESVSPLKEKKRKESWINPPRICSRFWIKTIPWFIWLPEKREKRRKRKKRPSVSVERLSHLQYLKLLGNYMVCALKKCISLLRFTVSTAYVCQPPTRCLHYAQSCNCSMWDVHLALTIARKIRWFKLHGPHSLLPKHIWSSFHSLHSCRFPAILLKLARTWPRCRHTSDYWTVYNALAVLRMKPIYLRQILGLPLRFHHYCSASWWSHCWVT